MVVLVNDPVSDAPIVWSDTDELIEARMLAAIPDNLNKVEGAWVRDFISACVMEVSRLRSEMNLYLAYTFPQWSFGPLLDAHALSYGITRGSGTRATGTVRFTGPEGTQIPSGAIVEAPTADPDADRIRFQTTNTTTVVLDVTGFVELDIEALDIGKDYNLPPGAITLPDTPLDDIEEITNPAPTTGGSDPDDDETLKRRVMDQAMLPTGGGTKLDYRIMATEGAGVGQAAIQAFWDTSHTTPGLGNPNNTIAISLRDPALAPVDWSVVQERQEYIDPSRQLLAIFENGEPWTATVAPTSFSLTWTAADKQMGASSLELLFAFGEGGPEVTELTLARRMDLSRFVDAADEFFIWLYASDWATVAATTALRLQETTSDYFAAALSSFSPDGTAKPATGSGWWLWRIKKGTFAAAGAPHWSSINSLAFRPNVTASGTRLRLDYWSIRSPGSRTGEGRATIGHAVTVLTPVSRLVNVTAQLTLDTGYTLTGAPGTTNITEIMQLRLADYLLKLEPGQPIRVKHIEDVIHDTPGVLDFSGVTIGYVGQARNERQTIATNANTGLTPWFIDGVTTSNYIAYNATAAAIQTQLNTDLGAGTTLVTGGPLPGTPITVEFTGARGNRDVPKIAIGPGWQIGAGSSTTTVTVVQEGRAATTAGNLDITLNEHATLGVLTLS